MFAGSTLARNLRNHWMIQKNIVGHIHPPYLASHKHLSFVQITFGMWQGVLCGINVATSKVSPSRPPPGLLGRSNDVHDK